MCPPCNNGGQLLLVCADSVTLQRYMHSVQQRYMHSVTFTALHAQRSIHSTDRAGTLSAQQAVGSRAKVLGICSLLDRCNTVRRRRRTLHVPQRSVCAGWAQLEADFATIQAAPATAKPPAPASSQAAKAASVANQVKLWEKALGVRITLQRGLIAADRLPRSAAHACALATVDGAAAEVAAAKREAAAVLGECMDAMHELLARTVEDGGAPAGEAPGAQIAEAASASASAAGEAVGDVCGAAWPLIEALEERFKPFRNEEIDRWHRRTLLASGQVAMRGGGGLQALNQPMSHQVSELLRNPDRALARTQRRRQAHDRVLCEPSAAAAAAAAGPDSEDEEGTEEGAAQPGGGDPAEAGGAAERDVESYDDSAFYQVLLHEFLEAAETDGRVSGVAQVRFLTQWQSAPRVLSVVLG